MKITEIRHVLRDNLTYVATQKAISDTFEYLGNALKNKIHNYPYKHKTQSTYHCVNDHASDTPPERLKSLRIKNHCYYNAQKSWQQLTFESRFEHGSFAHPF